MDYTDDRGTSGPSTDVSFVACVSAIPCDLGKLSPKRSIYFKNLECVHVSTKRKTKSNHKGRLTNTLKTWQNACINE